MSGLPQPKRFHTEGHNIAPTKKVLAFFFTVLISSCTVLGAIPVTINTPLGVVSTEVQTAEATNRNTTANRLRGLSARNSGASLVQNFSVSRLTYTVNVRQSTDHANMRFSLRSGQQARWRVDTRHATTGNWVNGSYNSWRTRTTSNTHRDVRVGIGQGRERRIRFQIRDTNGNIRTITVNIRRASGNTFAATRTANAGTWNRSFSQSVRDYTLTIPHSRTANTSVSMRPVQERAQARSRARVQNADGTWRAWTSWSSYSRGTQTRAVGTIPQGRRAQIQIMIRGAFSSMSNSPTRTGTYTITVIRPNPPVVNRTVSFNLHGGSMPQGTGTTRTVVSGRAIGTLPQPTRQGHTFVGWFTAATGGTQVTANTIVNANMTIHARWVQSPQVNNGWMHLPADPWFEIRAQAPHNQYRLTATKRWCEARELFDLINAHRAERGIPPFIHNEYLSDIAMRRAADSLVLFAHVRPDGSSFATMMPLDGRAGKWQMENLAIGTFNATGAFNTWRNSPGHRAIMEGEPTFGWTPSQRMHAGVGVVELPGGRGRALVLMIADSMPDTSLIDSPWLTGNVQHSFTGPINPNGTGFAPAPMRLLGTLR